MFDSKWSVLKYFSFLAILIFFLTMMLLMAGCSIINPPDVPATPPTCTISGAVVEVDSAGRRTLIPGVLVQYKERRVRTQPNGKFSLLVAPDLSHKEVTIEKDGYLKSTHPIPDSWTGHNIGLGQLVIEKDIPEVTWDFENTKLLGWSDPVSGTYYYTAKYRAIAQDTAYYGSNCGVVNLNRSNGNQYHNGNCADGRGWWEHILDDGWAYQFCMRNADGSYDTSHAHFPYENIHESEELSIKWLDQMEERVRILGETGQWAIVNLWTPYDNKHWGINWYYWTDDCSESPFTVGPNSRWYHPKQAVATKAFLNRIKDLPYVIINDNWEEMGFHGSVDIEWKQKVFSWVQDVMPNVPYFVYVGDDTENIPAVINWVNNEPRIAGINTHYRLFDDVHGDWGLSANKRVLHTEEMNLNAPKTYDAVEWCLTNDKDETCMYYGNYRDFMRGDGGPDVDKDQRDYWNPRIKALLQ